MALRAELFERRLLHHQPLAIIGFALHHQER
jgi:hypothetical protein